MSGERPPCADCRARRPGVPARRQSCARQSALSRRPSRGRSLLRPHRSDRPTRSGRRHASVQPLVQATGALPARPRLGPSLLERASDGRLSALGRLGCGGRGARAAQVRRSIQETSQSASRVRVDPDLTRREHSGGSRGGRLEQRSGAAARVREVDTRHETFWCTHACTERGSGA